MNYRKSHAFRIALITAACQRANMRHRVAALESGRATSVSVAVRSRPASGGPAPDRPMERPPH